MAIVLRRVRTFDSIQRYPDYRWLWLGSMTEHAGEWMETVALGWLMLQLTDSAFLLGLVGVCRMAPRLFFPLLGGLVADRVNRRNLLMASLLAFSVLAFALAALVATGVVQAWHVLVVVTLGGVSMSFNHPARNTILPNLVPRQDLTNAVSLDIASVNGSRILGPPLAGLLIPVLGTPAVFVARGLGCILAAFWLFHIKTDMTPIAGDRKVSLFKDFREGISYLRLSPSLLQLTLLWGMLYTVVHPYTNLLPIFARDILHAGPQGLGFLVGAAGAGALVGTLGLASMAGFRSKGKLLFATGIAVGIFMIFFSYSPWFLVSLGLVVIMGVTNSSYMAVNNTLIQLHATDEMRGRVMSVREVTMAINLFGSLVMGALADVSGAPLAVAVFGGVMALTSGWFLVRMSDVRRME
ncbi:MAG: MFS transporter [Chloroflexi bacterium]|nr:MFS transporter [Chloroflexota bacterium]